MENLIRTASYRSKCFAARSWSSSSELVLERSTREFHCVVVILGDGERPVLHQSDQLDVEVFKTFQRHLLPSGRSH